MIEFKGLRAGRVRHACFGREGGVSDGIFASLNCGFGSSDEGAKVAENRTRAMASLGLAGERLVTCYQVHGAQSVTVEKPWSLGEAPRADAMATRVPGVALGILTADCAPVLLADAEAGVVGAAHAGWRGAQGGVLEAALDAMERLGARRERIAAAIGPAIGFASYEVGPEFAAVFLAEDPANARFFAAVPGSDRQRFDLSGYVAARLERLGVGQAETSGRDTAAEALAFFSYRRSRLAGEADYGRQLSAICLAE